MSKRLFKINDNIKDIGAFRNKKLRNNLNAYTNKLLLQDTELYDKMLEYAKMYQKRYKQDIIKRLTLDVRSMLDLGATKSEIIDELDRSIVDFMLVPISDEFKYVITYRNINKDNGEKETF